MSDNPLLTKPRLATYHLFGSDVEDRLARFDEEIEAAFVKELSDKRYRAATDKLTAEHKAYLEKQQKDAPKLALEAVSYRRVQKVLDANPPRPNNSDDEAAGHNRESFPAALIRESLIEPEVTDEQWNEFVEQASAGRISALYQLVNEITGSDVDLPKSSAATTVALMRAREQRQPGVTA